MMKLSSVVNSQLLPLTKSLLSSNHPTLVAPPPNLKLLVQNLTVANVKLRIDTRPRNLIPIRCSSDQIENKGLSSSVAVGDGIVNPCLDIFSSINKGSEYFRDNAEACHKRFEELLPLAWSHNPLTTLKLILNLRDNTESGHGTFHEKAFNTAVLWLRKNHPETLASNLAAFADGSFGSIEDLIQILLLLKGHDMSTAAEMYERDPDYKLILDRVSDLFVKVLKSDIEILKKQKLKQCDIDDGQYSRPITKAATYCLYYINSSTMDLLCESMGRKIFPQEFCKGGGEEEEEADYANKVQEEVLEPLRKAFMFGRDEDDDRDDFEDDDDDPEEPICVIDKYFEEVKSGKSNIKADALLPNEIIGYFNHWNFAQVAELQWKKMVEHMSKQDKMNNFLAICHVDKLSWQGIHSMQLSVGFTLLMSELSDEPWKGKVFSFGNGPRDELRLIPFPSNELRHKWDFVTQRTMYWNSRFYFPMLFDLILQEAVDANLKPEQMIKKVFVFTGSKMFFEYFRNFWEDESDTDDDSSWEIIYGDIKREFKEKGYENAVPHLVFWNLSELDGIYRPTKWVMPSTKLGVTLLEGFSNNMVKFVVDNGGEIGPDLVMEAAISGEGYEKLVLAD